MIAAEFDYLASNAEPSPEFAWEQQCETYRLLVQVTQDDEGVYSAVAINLPGTGSSGPTEEEAISRFKEAAVESIMSYRDSEEEIPWNPVKRTEAPAGSRYVSVNV